MSADLPKLVDIPCKNDQCEHSRAGRCRLAEPIAAQKIHWLFALVDCPIAVRAAELTARADAAAKLGLVTGDSRIDLRQRYRPAALALHDADDALPGDRFLDHVTESLKTPGAGEAAAMAAVESLAARSAMRGRARRSSLVTRAGLLAFVLIAVLAAVGALIDRPRTTNDAPRLTAVTTSFRGDVGADRAFDVRVRVNAPLFLAVYLVPESGPIERLFPPLGTPEGLPWPLTESAGECLLPPSGGFRGPSEGRGFLVVAPGVDGPPVLDLLRDDERDRAAIERTAPGAAFFRYRVVRP